MPALQWMADEYVTVALLVAAALLSVIVLARTWSKVVVRHRSIPFSKETDSYQQHLRILATQYELHELVEKAQSKQAFKDAEMYVVARNNDAAELQMKYHARVAESVCAVAFGLIVLVLSITVMKGPLFKLFASAADVFALVYALASYIRAQYINRAWVRKRTFAELLRCWTHLSILFPSVSGDINTPEHATVETEAAFIHDSVIGNGNLALLHSNITKYWQSLKACCLTWFDTRALPEHDLGLYVRERPLAQLSFLSSARKRLRHFEKHRERYMLALYVATVLLALCKAVAAFRDYLPIHVVPYIDLLPPGAMDWIVACLLIALILSAAMTTIFVSRNDRSLVHRYRAQERRVRSWFSEFQHVVVAPTAAQVPARILAFEQLMLDELLDWVHITSHDVLELG